MLKATILVEPQAKGRPRGFLNKRTGHVQFYTPNDTRKAEAAIRATLSQVMSQDTNDKFLNRETPLRLEVTFFLSRPASLPKRFTLPVKKPDWDNLGKTLTDALEKYIYENDSQITTAVVQKRYGQPPRIELTLEVDHAQD